MRQIRTVVLVDGQTQSAFEAADMVLEEVGVFVKVDRLQRELAQALAPVCVRRRLRGDAAAAKFGSCSVLRMSGLCVHDGICGR